MALTRKEKWGRLVVVIAALACSGTWAADWLHSVQDRVIVLKTTETMKTVCVGRVLVDVPVNAEVMLSGERLDGFDVGAIEESPAEFKERVAAREVEIHATADREEGKGPGGVIEARDLEVRGLQGRVITFGRDRTSVFENGHRVDSEWVSIEAYAHVDGVSFTLSANPAREADALRAEALLARLRLRGESEIPAVSGFCSWRAVFAEPLPEHQGEHIRMSIRLPEFPELTLSLASFPGGDTGESLLKRISKTNAQADFLERLLVSNMRSGKRSINSIQGEEALERIRELNFATGYSFMWEAAGIENDVLHPFLSLELHSGISSRPGGEPTNSTLHQDAILALWDRISSSIRLHDASPPQLARR
jgi:hypothetical protein